MSRLYSAIGVVLITAACSSSDTVTTETPDATSAAATTTDQAPDTTQAPVGSGAAIDDDLRSVSIGELDAQDTIVVPIAESDMSFLAWARSESIDDELAITSIVDPDGKEVYRLDFSTFETSGPAYRNAPLAGFGEAAVLYPPGPAIDLISGDYFISFETEGAFLVDSGVIIRSGDPDAPQALNVRFWMVNTVEQLADQATRSDLEARLRRVGDEVLTPHLMSIGELDIIDAPQDIVDRFSTLELGANDGIQRELCLAMDSGLPPARSLNIVIVERISAPDDEDSIIEGNAAGLPGVVLVPGAATSCVVMMGGPDGGRDVFDRAVTAWHESAHLIGLPHTTESDGTVFDFFDDTPECEASTFDGDGDGFIDEFECPDGENFMFHDSDGTTLTADQAWMMRRHPLFQESF